MSIPHVPSLVPGVATVNVSVRYTTSLLCAASAGVHLALVPEHYREAGPPLAGAFAASVVALMACALLLRGSPLGPARGVVVVLCLLGVAGAYVSSRTVGIPMLIPEPEEVDALGVVTTAAEIFAAALAGRLVLPRKEHR